MSRSRQPNAKRIAKDRAQARRLKGEQWRRDGYRTNTRTTRKGGSR